MSLEASDVTVVVHKADNLVSTRKSQNNSYSVVMKMDKHKFRTKQIKFTDSPIWQEVAMFKKSKVKLTSIFYLVVTDKEEIIGQVCIPFSQVGTKPTEPMILEAPLAPHKKCPVPLGGTLFYEIWKSNGPEPEMPTTRVITGDNYFAASERSATLPSSRPPQSQLSFKRASILDLFGSTTSLATSPSVTDLSGNQRSDSLKSRFSSCTDLTDVGWRHSDRKSSTLGSKIRNRVKRIGSKASIDEGSFGGSRTSRPAFEDMLEEVDNTSPSRESLGASTRLSLPSAKSVTSDDMVDSSFHKTGSDEFRNTSSLPQRCPSTSSGDSGASRDCRLKEREKPEGSRNPEPPVSKGPEPPVRKTPEPPVKNPHEHLWKQSSDSKSDRPDSSQRLRIPATPFRPVSPETKQLSGSWSSPTSSPTPPSMTPPPPHERIIQGSESIATSEKTERADRTLTSSCNGCRLRTAEAAAASEEILRLNNEVTDLRVRVQDLEETNGAMRQYVESLVSHVMEECPWILEQGVGKGNSKDRKYATIGVGNRKMRMENPFKSSGFNMAKKQATRPFGRPLVNVPSISKLFSKSSRNLAS